MDDNIEQDNSSTVHEQGDSSSTPESQGDQNVVTREEYDALHGRATRAEQALKKMQTALSDEEEKPEPAVEDKLQAIEARLSANEEIAELARQGYSDDEIKTLRANGGLKALENPIIKAGIEAQRAQERDDQATPPPRNQAPVIDGKTYAEIITDPEATQADKQRAFEIQRDALLKKGGNQVT